MLLQETGCYHINGPKDRIENKALRSKNGVELPKQLAGFQGAAPLAGSLGATPPKEIYILGSPKWENQGQNQVQSIKTEKTRKAEKSVRAVWYIRSSGFRPGGNFSIRAGTSREHQILEIK